MEFNLSKAQIQIYNLEKIIGETVCNITCSFLKPGCYEPEIMKKSVDWIYRNHDAMRMRILDKSVPKQEVLNTYDLEKCYQYLFFETKEEFHSWAREKAKEPIGIKDCLAYIYGVNINNQYGGILLHIHHIISDAWTAIIVGEDFFDNYELFSSGKEPQNISTSYLEYLKDEEVYIASSKYEKDKQYWQQQYKQEFSAKMSHKAVNDYSASRLEIREERSSELLKLCRERGVSAYNAYMTALGMYIAKENRTDACCIGTALLNRSNKREKETVGIFVNTVGICENFAENTDFLSNVKAVKRTTFDAMRHQKCNFVDAISEHVGQNMDSMYDTYVSYQNVKEESIETKWYFCGVQNTNLAVTISDWNDEDELLFHYDYRNQIFREEEIHRIHAHLIEFMINALQSEEAWENISFISKEEKEEILNANNLTENPLDYEKSLKQCFEEQVEKTPDKLACIFGNEKLTYRELNEKSNQIAHMLKENNIGQDDFVCLIAERSCEMIEAIFGILKAGAAYVPIAKSYPSDRIEYILKDCNPKMILTYQVDKKLETSVPVVELSKELLQSYPSENLQEKVKADALAYAIYTSGTTGKPKGVMIENRSVVSFCSYCEQNHFQKKLIDGCDYVIAASNIAFDIHLQEIELPLLNGLTVILLNEESENGFGMLEDALQKYEKIGIISTPTLMGARLHSTKVKKNLNHVSLFMIGAESFPPDLYDRLRKYTDATIINGYGPTETTCGVLYDEVMESDDITIGTPIANTKAYVMNHGQLCGYGMTGELYIAGAGLARGYINLEEQTKEVFVENPFESGKMYRTGDLVKLRCDGKIDYCGRIDEQIKIRGFRVELEEIRRTLIQCDGVLDAVVVKRVQENDIEYLAAFFTAESELDIAEIEYQLKESLPDYMVPSCFMQLENLPVNTNGKVDLKRLPDTSFQEQHEYVEAETPLQKAVAEAFCNVFQLERVGLEDSLFEIGGDSIKALSVATYLREQEINVDVSDIIRHKTVRSIAKCLEEKKLHVFSQEEVTGNVAMTPLQSEFFKWDLEKPEHFNQSVLVEAKDELHIKKVIECVDKLLAHHDMLRAVVEDSQLVIKSVEDFEDVKVEEHWLKEQDTEEQIRNICSQLQTSFQMHGEPLIRIALLHSEKQDYIYFVAHHLIVDGLSWRIILDDFAKLYEGKGISKKEMSFPQWGSKLREYSGMAGIQQEAFQWKQLAKSIKRREVAKLSRNQYSYAAKKVSIPVKRADIIAFNEPFKIGVDEYILWKLSYAFGTLQAQNQVAVMIEKTGRTYLTEDVLLEHTVGWFTNVFPILIGGETKQDCLDTVKRQMARVHNDGLGYGIAKEILGNEELGCEADIAFNYLGEMEDLLGANPMFKMSDLDCGLMVAKENKKLAPLTVDTYFAEGQLVVDLSYNELMYEETEIQELLDRLARELGNLDEQGLDKNPDRYLEQELYHGSMPKKAFVKICDKIPVEQIEKITDLAPMQEAMVYYKMLSEDSKAYFIQNSMTIHGSLEVKCAADSFKLLAYKHAMLRSRIIYRGLEKPYCVQLKDAQVAVNVYEDKAFDVVEREDLEAGFDLETDSLLRLSIVKLEHDQYKMIWSFHHSIIDGWCMDILYMDFINNYRQLSKGLADYDTLAAKMQAEQSREYSDYLEYRKYLNEQKGLEYWSELLTDCQEASEIQYFEKGNSKEEVGTIIRECPPSLNEKLDQLARKNGVTKNTVLETAWGIFLMRYSGFQDVVFGKTVSGRNANLSGISGMVGLFINTIPVRVSVNKELDVNELLHNMQGQAEESGCFDYCSLVEIQKAAGLSKDFIKSLFVYENYEFHKDVDEQLEGVQIEFDEVREQTDYNLSIAMSSEESLKLRLLYKPDYYTQEQAQLFMDGLCCILECMAAGETSVQKIIYSLPDAEKDQVLTQFNKSKKGQKYSNVLDILRVQFEERAEELAVSDEERTYTFRQLEEKANEVATVLLGKGVKKNDIVAIAAERNVDTVALIVGTLLAGAAFMPIDPEFPEERIAFMLKDSQAVMILTSKEEEAFGSYGLPVVGTQNLAAVPMNPVNVQVESNDLCYVIYTSGTTGKPKGVLIEQEGVANLIEYFSEELAIKAGSNILHYHNFIFDGACWELFMGLGTGSHLFIIPKEIMADAYEVKHYILKHEIQVAALPPQLYLQQEEYKLDTIITAGSQAVKEVVEKARLCGRYINSYGPTEGTVCATHWIHEKGEIIPDRIPIGIPVGNKSIYILSGGELCGVGMPGELCITGTGLARCYQNLPELTEEKFVQNPYGDGRMYRTGDLARWLPDGNIEYLGRADEQIKVRGFRVELTEVERVIRKQQNIDDVTVIAKQDQSKENYLVAYLVSGERELDITALQEQVSLELPEYMIPSAFMVMDKIPMTRNGKVDKKALPEVTFTRKTEYVAPATELERCIASLFEKVLAVDNVGANDNFFELGGHSLRAARLTNEIESELHIRVPLKEVFDHATPRLLAKIVGEMNAEDQEKIEAIEAMPYYPMSSSQRRTYFISQMDESKLAYNMPMGIWLKGAVEPKRVEHAFTEVVARHAGLRTSFHVQDGEYVQIVHDMKEMDVQIVFEECYGMTKEEIENRQRAFIEPFDLSKAPLVRLLLLQVDEEEFYMFMDMHHIVSDGGSMNIILKDFMELYNGETLPELGLQYKDYSAWLDKREWGSQRDYWKAVYADEIPVLEMPLDFTRPREQSFHGKKCFVSTQKQFHDLVKEFAVQTETTDYMILLSSLMVLLGKYSRQDDIVVGTSVSGRTRSETESIVGMFVNTLAMRGKPEKEKTFHQFLNEMKNFCFDAFENQEYPFDLLLNDLAIEKRPNRNPLFDVMFVMQNNELPELKLRNVQEVKGFMVEDEVAKFDLTISIQEADGRYEMVLEYCDALFTETSIELFGQHYVQMAEWLIRNEKERLQFASCLEEKEREQVLYQFNDSFAEYEKEKTVAQIFEEQVKLHGDKIALEYENESYTYHELNEMAKRYAARVCEEQVSADDRVVVIGERSAELVAAILGVLKAGCAYVPIDVSYPKERMEYIIEDCQPKLIFGEEDFLTITDAIPCVNLFEKELPMYQEENDVVGQSSDLAYIIYTSGTTGKPKGTLVENKSITRLVKNSNFVPLSSDTVVLQTGAMAFDASTFEVWGSLLNGGRLILAAKDAITDLKEMERLIKEKQVNTMWLTSTLFNQMTDANARIFETLEYLLIGGEKLSEKHVAKFYEQVEGVQLINGYGPTENTTFTATYAIPRSFEKIMIGKPISNTEIYIMDGDKLAGINMPGELCTTGDGVARGYLNLEELTKEKFRENPFGSGRMYRTGDLARWCPDGNIEYLGRIDEQVKIRGFRIELQEIENIIKQDSDIKDACVMVQQDNNGEKYIVAYFSAVKEMDIAALKDRMKGTLPNYMIPSGFMQLEKLPTNQNGKINKSKLPYVEFSSSQTYREAETKMQEIMVSVFCKVLDLEKVGIDDSFFELGGHSLKAAALVNAIEEATGVHVPLREVYYRVTPAQIAEYVEEHPVGEYQRIPIAEEKKCYKASATQKRLFIIDQIDDMGIAYNMPSKLKVNGQLDIKKLQDVLQALADRHEALRTYFVQEDGEPVQYIEKHVVLKADYEEIIGADEAAIKEEYRNFVQPFDLGKAPLMRCKAVKTGEEEFLLFFDMHHIIGDGQSMAIITEEFSKLYNGEVLEKQEIQYKDYSEWMRTRNLDTQKEFWLSQLDGELPTLELPLDYKRPQYQTFHGNNIYVSTGTKLYDKVKAFAKNQDVSEYMVLLSSLMVLLGKYDSKEDVIVGSPVSGRTHKDVEHVLGMFVNTMAMRGKPEKSKVFKDFLQEMKDTCLKAYENQEFPFEELLEELDIPRDVSRNPLFDIMFSYQNGTEAKMMLDGLKVNPFATNDDFVAKFDMTVNVTMQDDSYSIMVEYNTDLFKQESVEYFAAHYVQILEQIVENPNRKIGEYTAISDSEMEQVTVNFNQFKYSYDETLTVDQLIKEQVELHSENRAVSYDGESLTYKDLYDKAAMIAKQLKAYNIGKNHVVAMITERSLEMIIGLYGIMLSGAAFVPVDPEHPQERIEYILEDCNAKAVIVNGAHGANIHNLPVITVDRNVETQDVVGEFETSSQPTDLLYMIYTSGTTGKPKGVMIEHAGVVNMTMYFKETIGVTHKDNILQQHNYVFDGAMWEIMMALTTGACLTIVPLDTSKDPAILERFITEQKITVAALPPQVYMQQGDYPIDKLITAGSESSYELVQKADKNAKVYINSYGPTECTVCATHWDHKMGEEIPSHIPIGRPMLNKQIYILQGDMLCGVGIPGELCVTGKGLARGYFKLEELTKEKFRKNPFGEGRIYHTGDLARWLPDGTIEYLGRIDQQVKIRGFRVELLEIENVLRSQPSVADAAVIARKDAEGENYIVAFVTSQDGESLDIAQLKTALSEELPVYMIPAGMMQIDKIPVTAAGKVDKRSLPEVELTKNREYVEPRNQEEQTIADIFAQVLNLDKVGALDNFFEMGGHSLKATKVVNEVERLIGKRIALKVLFENPTPEMLAQVVFGTEKREYEMIPKAEEMPAYDMSSVQKRMYLISQMGELTTTYNTPAAFTMKGKFDIEKVNETFQKLVERHEILRTRFCVEGERYLQIVEPNVDVQVSYEQKAELSKEQMQDEFEAFMQPFDLEKLPLIRMKVVEMEQHSMLMMDMHHIVSDGQSIQVLMDEFIKLYQDMPLQENLLQYRDYSQWAKDRALTKQKEYWLRQFEELPEPLALLTDYPRPQSKDHEGAIVRLPLGKEIREQIVAYSKAEGATEYVTLAGMVMLLLSKYSRQDDITLGSPFSGRTHYELQNMLGMFVNTLVLRGKPEPEKTFKEYMKQVRQMCMDAFEHQDYPFEELVNQIDVPRDFSRNPLFDVLFTYQSQEQQTQAASCFDGFQMIDPKGTKAKFDIAITVAADENGYEVIFEYATALFKKDTIERMASHLKVLLAGISQYEDKKLQEISMLPAEEEQKVRDLFNQTKMDYPKDKTIIDLWNAQVKLNKDELAVIANDGSYTFEQVDMQSNIIANTLKKQNVKANDVVAIIHGRAKNLLVAMYGIIKAGAAYLPVDPNLPEDRIRFMLEDSHCTHVITDNEQLKETYENVMVIDKVLEECKEAVQPVNQAKPDGVCYVIYTSGSTGQPKGTIIANRNVMNYICNNHAIVQAIKDDDAQRMVATTTISFDASHAESLLCLPNGITVVMADEEEQNNQKRLNELTVRTHGAAMHTTPSKMKSLMYDKSQLDYLKQMKVILLGGEALHDELCKEIRSITDAKIFNVYGPSETTVWITVDEIEDGDATIGYPFANTQIYITDHDCLCGIGVPGELCIAGDSVGYGYLNRDDLTEERFVENPYGTGKLYHSGDVARWLPDGRIEYLGRMDAQVKINGQRIELKEIESCIIRLEEIEDAAVVVNETNGNKRLCAYYVSTETVSPASVQAKLRKVLPVYMVPADMMQIDRIPVTKNGKLDKKALPEITFERSESIVKPRNQMEEMVVEAFKAILEIEEAGIFDSFFELGGNSLKIAALINYIEQETGVRIPFKEMFQNTTPEQIAEYLKETSQSEADRILPAEKKDEYPMSAVQQRIFVVQQIDKNTNAYNMPTAIEMKGHVDPEKAKAALQQLINRHEVLRTSFHQIDDRFVQRIHDAVEVDFSFEDMSNQEVDDTQLLEQFVRPFDLTKAPMIHSKMVKAEEGRYILFLDLHHIITDGGSTSILVDEFCTFYNGGEPAPLGVQYKDYSEWMRNKNLDSQEAYWISQFNDTLPVLDMPYDHARKSSQSYAGDFVFAQTDMSLVNKVDKLARETGTTEYMILLSAFMMLLGKYSRQEDIIVGSPVSGRTNKDTETMLGMFVNTLAMRAYPEADKDYLTFLEEIKETCLMAYENQEYPFEEMIEHISVERDMSRNPLFDVMFVLQNNKEAVLQLDGVSEIRELNPAHTISKFDITANVKRGKDGYMLVFEYSTGLFEKETMEYFMKHYLELLNGIVSDTHRKLKDYSEVAADEWNTIQEFNDTWDDVKETRTVLELFEEQVRKTPHNIAVEYHDESITYDEFNQKVNQLAHQLRELGVGRDDFVCVIAKRSIQMMIGIFAVIKAGGAYVPIDANYPEERIQYIIGDCNPKAVLLAKTELQMEVPVPVINLMDEAVYTGSTENPEIINVPEDLIYLIYTSGTTGQPKGVMNTREGCTNYMCYRQWEHALTEKDAVLQKTTYTFDVSVWEIIWWSTTGAKVIMLEQGDEKDVEAICDEIYRKKITVMHFVPSMLQVFVSHLSLNPDERYKVGSLEAVYASGEALKPDTVQIFHEVMPKTTDLINLYGPTEASIDVTRFNCDKDYEKIYIGKPIANTEIYILNDKQTTGIGIPGELGIVGKGLARGYLNREDLTNDKFIQNPFGEGRLYRTGDLARLLPDGNIEYLGRIDEQVKIRGFRIELGEIENAIRKQEGIRDVAVVAREDANGEKFIAAYVVRFGQEEQDFESIKAALRSKLPDYMVPAAFMQIDSIPVTKNGKLDRRALPDIERVSDREYVEPVTEKEKLLAEILSDVLGVKRIGLYDDFYELGGDSIKAIRVVSKLREIGYKLDVKEIMQERTLQGMANYLGEAEENMYEQGEVTGEIPRTPIVQEFLNWQLPKPEHFNQAIMLKCEDAFDREALTNALDAIWRHHDALRSIFADQKQKIVSANELQYELEVYDYRGKDSDEIRRLVKEQCEKLQASFVLDKGPLMKVALYQVDGEEHLFICLHHLVIDGVSWRIILEDLLSAYAQYETAQMIQLPKKTASIDVWAKALHEFADKEVLKEELAYWKGVSEHAGVTKVNADVSKRYQSCEVVLEGESCSLLHEAMSTFNTDMKDLLLTAVSKTSKEVLGKEKMVVLMEGHGRETIHKEVHIDRTVGWFTSIYPVVLDYKQEMDNHIISTKETLRKIPRNGFGYGILRHIGEHDLEMNGDLTFNYLGDLGTELSEESKIDISDYEFGVSSASENHQMADITINGSLAGDALRLSINYNVNMYSEETMKDYQRKLKETLVLVGEFCCSKEETVVTASDIGAEDMNEDELSALLDLL